MLKISKKILTSAIACLALGSSVYANETSDYSLKGIHAFVGLQGGIVYDTTGGSNNA